MRICRSVRALPTRAGTVRCVRVRRRTRSDGTKRTAIVEHGKIYTSTDSGVTWTENTDTHGGSNKKWQAVAMSR